MRYSYVFAALLLFAGVSFAQNMPKFSGLFFGDYYYVLQHDPSNTNVDPTSTFAPSGALTKNMQAFDYRRIYLTADYGIAQDFSARFRLESDPSTSYDSKSHLSTMVKDAFITWKNVAPGGNIIIGLQGTPEINMAEGIFGYRPLEKTIQDLHGISSSRDLGVSYNQKFSDQFSAGLLVGNGSGNGILNTNTTRYKFSYLYLQFNPVKDIVILLNGEYGGQAADQFTRIGDIIVNYNNGDFSLGAQYFLSGKTQPPTAPNQTLPTTQSNGLSLNGWVQLIPDLRLVARYDNYTPTSASDKNTQFSNSTQSLILGALDWAVRKNVHFMPNVEYVAYGKSGSNPDVLARATFYISF